METLQTSDTTNPLLEIKTPVPFSAIRAEHVEPAIHSLLKQMQERVDEIGSPSARRTYKDVLLGLDRVTEPLDYAMALVRHLESVVTTPELRAAHNAVQGPVSAFYSSIPLNADLWSAVKEVAQSPDANSLKGVHKRFLEKTLAGFRRAGAELDLAGKQRLEAIEVALTEATTKFAENVLDATNAYELLIMDEPQLSGLPDSAKDAARESARSKGKEGWRFTLQAPSYIAAMTYLDDRGIRQQLWDASNRRGTAEPFDNRAIVAEVLRLRKEKAQLLGYRDFSDLVLEERMAHNGSAAANFLEDLRLKTQAAFDRENDSLAEFARTLGYATVEPWDVAYLAEKQRLALYDFDEEELRPYFQLENVVSGMFQIFSRAIGHTGYRRSIHSGLGSSSEILSDRRRCRTVSYWAGFMQTGIPVRTSAEAHGWIL